MNLLEQAQDLRIKALAHLQEWPRRTDNREHGINYKDLTPDFKIKSDALIKEIQICFNVAGPKILPQVLTPKDELYYTMRSASASMRKQYYKRPYPINNSTVRTIDTSSIAGRFFQSDQRMDVDVDCSIENAIEEANQAFSDLALLIQSVPNIGSGFVALPSDSAFIPNTAFIIMRINKDIPELEDVHGTIKEVCNRFGIHAERADDIEHSDRITDLILNKIKSSEFLIADLSGERPNVYYEIGFAHALGKRPILFRKMGTALHFDLSIHNVPEYKNLSELKTMLTKRFEAIMGKEISP